MGRSIDRHVDNEELSALVPVPSEGGPGLHGLSADSVREAERHVLLCADCRRKVSKYREVVHGLSKAAVTKAAPRSAGCPKDEDVDWQEVAAGLWPEWKATQLMMHAALCEHCGPLLRAAVSADAATPLEEKLLAELKAPSRPDSIATPKPVAPRPWPNLLWPNLRWLVPAATLMAIAGIFFAMPRSSPTFLASSTRLTGTQFAEFAVRTHRQHAQGSLALDVRGQSQQTLNEWLKEKSPFSVALPASLEAPGEERPNRLEGARLVQVGGKTAAYIAYQMQTAGASLPVSLMVAPDSVAVASGGLEVNFKKVSFHYSMVEGHRVVTWSLHGLTYALVSQEGNRTQQSCMVCHSAMRDRDLSQTPTPLGTEGNSPEPVWQ